MADSETIDGLIKASTHLGAGAGGAGIVAWLSRMFQARESQAVATELALLRNDVTTLAKALERHEALGERVALLEASLRALHERFDSFDQKSRRRR